MYESSPQDRRERLEASAKRSGEVLVRETRPSLLRLARRLGLDFMAALDAVQQAYQALFTERPNLADVEAWLHRVVRDRCLDRRRRVRIESRILASVAESGARDPAPLPAADRIALRAAVNRLPRRQRELVKLHYFHGNSEAEAARLAGYAPGSGKKLLARARVRLRSELGPGAPSRGSAPTTGRKHEGSGSANP